MLTKSSRKNKTTRARFSAGTFHEKIVELTKGGVAHVLKKKAKKFEEIPWQNQFLPFIIKHLFQFGHLKNVNPGMSHYSGMIEIPKSEINKHLPAEKLPQTLLCKSKTSWKKIADFAKKIGYPVMCKPNTGERSSGVQFITEEAELKVYTESSENAFLLQEYCAYVQEFGISVERKKNRKFAITSIAQKETPFVIGDGKSSVKILVNALPLTEEQRQKIQTNASPKEWNSVPEKGEKIQVVRTASISLGTKIIDIRNQLQTDKNLKQSFETVFNDILKKYRGFNVGRFDIKADSLADIAKGNFKIIELNGAGGIPMHVYDDRLSVKEKYEELDQYFDRLFAMAQENQRRQNLRPAGLLRTIGFFFLATKRQKVEKKLQEERKANRKEIWRFVLSQLSGAETV